MHNLINQDTRRSILTLLALDSDYQLNQELIGMALEANGKTVTADTLSNQLSWLAEQDFITLETLSALKIATLTDRGLEIAKGKSRVAGVRDLRPSEIAHIKGK